MQSTDLRLSRLAPELPVASLHAAAEYYSARLGFLVAMRMDDYVIVERDGVAIHLFDNMSREHTPVGIHIFTPDLDALFTELETRGATIVQQIEVKPRGNREFRVLDVDKNELKFTEPL